MIKRLVLVCGLMLSGTAMAQNAYVGIGAAKALEDFDVPGLDASDTYDVNVLLGYRFNKNFALEGEAEFLGAFDVDNSSSSDNLENTASSISAKIFPIEGAIQPFALAGIGILHMNSSARFQENTSNWMLLYGGGVDFIWTDTVTLELVGKYHVPKGDLDDFRYWTIGSNLQFRF